MRNHSNDVTDTDSNVPKTETDICRLYYLPHIIHLFIKRSGIMTGCYTSDAQSIWLQDKQSPCSQKVYIETIMSSFWRNFHHWQHWKLSFWQLSLQPALKTSSKWQHLHFSFSQWKNLCNRSFYSQLLFFIVWALTEMVLKYVIEIHRLKIDRTTIKILKFCVSSTSGLIRLLNQWEVGSCRVGWCRIWVTDNGCISAA